MNHPRRPPLAVRFVRRLEELFLRRAPALHRAFGPLVLLSLLLYLRSTTTSFVFDEQQAILGNPYVRSAADPGSTLGWLDALQRDFWGLEPKVTIGSYRPLPDLIWRLLWAMGLRDHGAFAYALLNAVLHGLNGALLVVLVWSWTRARATAWLAGALFVATAVLTEAVSGAVGLADVLGGAAALLALLSLSLPLPQMAGALVALTSLGLYSKESALCVVPLVPLAALFAPSGPSGSRASCSSRWARAGVAALATTAAFVFYVEARKRSFPVAPPAWLSPEATAGASWFDRTFAAALRWYAQPTLPADPLNNPLFDASAPHRVAGALRVFARGFGQVVLPLTLSGDYSAPQEPVPDRLVFPESVVGAVVMAALTLGAVVAAVAGWARSRRTPGRAVAEGAPVRASTVAGFAAAWCVVSYIPVSNLAVLLPTVRAERFWYFPAIGTAILLAIGMVRLFERARRPIARAALVVVFASFFAVQCAAARSHASDYTDDLTFWDATRKASPNSAKAHLDYAVAVGARGDLQGRLRSNDEALRLEPGWAMANVYEGEVLCRLHRAPEAMPYFVRGFSLAPNDRRLVAVGLQALWEAGRLTADSPVPAELIELAHRHPKTWLGYLVTDTLENGARQGGVNAKYAPRTHP